jgi:hypothetical protein
MAGHATGETKGVLVGGGARQNRYGVRGVLRPMGDRACYLEFCPACDASVSVADEACPDCGAALDGGARPA